MAGTPVLYPTLTPLDNPPITDEFVSVNNGHLWLNGQRFVGFGVNIDSFAWVGVKSGNPPTYSANAVATMRAWLDNLVNMGVRVVRLHSWDELTGGNIFSWFNDTTTRRFDGNTIDVLAWAFNECKVRNIRVIFTLHYLRQLVVTNDVPDVPSPLFYESATSNSPFYGTLSEMHPWFWYDTGLQWLQTEYIKNILTYVSKYSGLPLGQDPVLLSVTIQNETSLAKTIPYSYSPTKYPFMSAALIANLQAWCIANGVNYNTMSALQHVQWAVETETQVLQAEVAFARQYTPALITAGTFYGNAQCGCIKTIYEAGDMVDFHMYAGTTPNQFLVDITNPTNTIRTSFSALCAACNLGKPTLCTEWAPVGNNARNPDSDRSKVMAAVVGAAVQQDVDMLFLYSYMHATVNNNPGFWNPGLWDFIDDALFLKSVRTQIAKFHDVDLRPTSVTMMPFTPAKYYGYNSGSNFIQPLIPYEDPDILSVPQTTCIQMFMIETYWATGSGGAVASGQVAQDWWIGGLLGSGQANVYKGSDGTTGTPAVNGGILAGGVANLPSIEPAGGGALASGTDVQGL